MNTHWTRLGNHACGRGALPVRASDPPPPSPSAPPPQLLPPLFAPPPLPPSLPPPGSSCTTMPPSLAGPPSVQRHATTPSAPQWRPHVSWLVQRPASPFAALEPTAHPPAHGTPAHDLDIVMNTQPQPQPQPQSQPRPQPHSHATTQPQPHRHAGTQPQIHTCRNLALLSSNCANCSSRWACSFANRSSTSHCRFAAMPSAIHLPSVCCISSSPGRRSGKVSRWCCICGRRPAADALRKHRVVLITAAWGLTSVLRSWVRLKFVWKNAATMRGVNRSCTRVVRSKPVTLRSTGCEHTHTHHRRLHTWHTVPIVLWRSLTW